MLLLLTGAARAEDDLTNIPQQIIAHQSIEGGDAVTRATVTSQAIVNGTAKALASGAR
jgi:uncharacterized protein with FMN-binding domain